MRSRARACCAAGAARRIGLAALAAAPLLASGATSASALVVHLPNGNTISVQPLRGAAPASTTASTGRLEYHGGPIMPSNTNYAVFGLTARVAG